MGPDDKRGELDKIAKAQAINKAATEKAAREKEKADKEAAAREAKEAAAPKAQTTKRGGEVALPTLPDEDQGTKSSKSKPVEISPKLESATAAAPPPSKPADDKFIDKLLKEEGSGKKKRASTSSGDDKALLDILATDKPAKPAAKGKGKSDGVDSLLQDVDKPAAPTPKIKHETPEWMKPEIQASTTPAPAIVKSAPRRDDGVIHVVQGAAGTSAPPSSRSTATASRPAPAPTRSVQASMTSSSSRRQTASAPAARSGNWNDPFADAPRKNVRPNRDLDQDEVAPPPRRNSVATRQARDDDDDYAAPRKKSVASRSVRDDDDDAPPVRRNASAPAARNTRGAVGRRGTDDDAWDDPFDKRPAGGARRASAPAPAPKPAREPARTAPSGKGGKWDDPFTENKSSAKPGSRSNAVAMRDNGRDDSTPNKWGSASKRSSSSDESGAADSGSSSSKGRWGILKKR